VAGIDSRKVNYILDADIRSFSDGVSQEWLTRFVEHRIGDKRIIRLIRKWLKAGVLEDGVVAISDKGWRKDSPRSAGMKLANRFTRRLVGLLRSSSQQSASFWPQASGELGRVQAFERAIGMRPDRIDEPIDRSAANRSG
jgi:hypothetical protein